MRVRRGLLGWGVFFIVLGAVPLAVRAGALDPATVRNAWQLWPLILVGIGLGLVLARTRLAVLGGLIVAATFGLMAGALIATGIAWSSGGFAACGFGAGDRGTPFPSSSGAFGPSATVRLEMDCGEVTVGSADGTGWTLQGTSEAGRPPDVTAGDRQLVIRAPGRTGIDLGAAGWSWQLTLPRQGAVTVDASVNAGSGRLDLGGMTVPQVDATVNAGDVRLDLRDALGTGLLQASVNAGSLSALLPAPEGTLRGSVSVNAGSAELCVPDGVALRFRGGDQALGSVNFEDRGLARAGDTWTTPGYESAASRIELEVSVNLGSIALNPEDGCD